MRPVEAWRERLRPRSSEGDVYRDEWVEMVEPIFYGAFFLLAFLGVVNMVAQGEWLIGAGFLLMLSAMILVTRVWFFRPHLVVGNNLLVLVGVLGTRWISIVEVRSAVAAKGALKLKLADGHEVYVPGHFLWSHARGDCYEYLAQKINARIAIATSAEGVQGGA